MTRPLLCCALAPRLLSVALVAVASCSAARGAGQSHGPDSTFERCRTITDHAAQLRCYEEAISEPPADSSQRSTTVSATWHLVRTTDPHGGRDTVSIIKAADISRSDLDLAGLVLRCHDGAIEVLLVLIEPLPPRAQPKVTVEAAGRRTEFNARVVSPGALVLLPSEATKLAAGPWQAAPELSITVAANPISIRGVISLAGLAAALPALQANCPLE